jgi:hypothetical protein
MASHCHAERTLSKGTHSHGACTAAHLHEPKGRSVFVFSLLPCDQYHIGRVHLEETTLSGSKRTGRLTALSFDMISSASSGVISEAGGATFTGLRAKHLHLPEAHGRP